MLAQLLDRRGKEKRCRQDGRQIWGNMEVVGIDAFKHIMQNICCSTKCWKLAEWWDVLLGVGLVPVIAYFSLSGCAVKMLDCS